MPRRTIVLATCLTILAVGVAPASPAAGSDPAREAERLSRSPIRADGSWKANLLDDDDGYVYPRRVEVRGTPGLGAVENPDGLMAADKRSTIIRSTGTADAPTPTLVLDLGLNTGGFVEVGVTASDGTPFRLGYSEAREFLRPIGDITPRPAVITTSFGTDDDPDHRNDVFRPRAGTEPQSFKSPAVRGGQRWIWLQVEGAGTVSIDFVRVRVTHLRPSPKDYTGWFHSSDDGLNQIWRSAVYTANLTTVRDARVPDSPFVHVDGAKRDRLAWTLNAGPSALTALYSVDTGAEVTRNTLNMFACQQEPSGYIPMASQIAVTCPVDDRGNPVPGDADGPPPGTPPHDVLHLGNEVTLPAGTALWVVGLHQYWLHTGDAAFVQPLLDVARRAVQFFVDRSVDGLFLNNTHRPEITWHPADPAGGSDTYTNVQYFRAVTAMAALERALVPGPDGIAAAAAYQTQAEQLRKAMLRRLWDPLVGAFLVNDVDPLRNHTSDANVEAVRAGVVTGDQAVGVLDFVRRRLHTEIGTLTSEYPADPFMARHHDPFIMAPEIWSRFEHHDTAHDTAEALSLLRRGFGRMANADPGTMWERIGPAGERWFGGPGTDNFGSLAHAYSAVAPALSAWVLGIRPVAPGFADWTVAPQPGDLRFAQGQVTTPAGIIASRWERDEAGRTLRLTAVAPAHAAGTVSVPLLDAKRVIAMDGVVVWDGSAARAGAVASSDGTHVHFANVTGTHTFAWSSAA